MIDTNLANACVRELVRRVMGMPANSVRPADHHAPSGGQTAEIATVKIISAEPLGTGGRSYETVGTVPEDVTTERIDMPIRIVASVNFYRSPNADAAGLARFSTAAFGRAASLDQRLRLSSSIDLMVQMGLLFQFASAARDLTALTDGRWESRGQVDLTFEFVNRETETIQTILTVPVDLTVIGPATTSKPAPSR